jgi:hypothetical protein
MNLSNQYTFSQVREFEYTNDLLNPNNLFSSAGTVLNRTITVVDKRNSHTAPRTFDTVGAPLVPPIDTKSIATSMKNAGFGIDGMHTFQDRYKRYGDKQTLIIWTSNEIDLSKKSLRCKLYQDFAILEIWALMLLTKDKKQ